MLDHDHQLAAAQPISRVRIYMRQYELAEVRIKLLSVPTEVLLNCAEASRGGATRSYDDATQSCTDTSEKMKVLQVFGICRGSSSDNALNLDARTALMDGRSNH